METKVKLDYEVVEKDFRTAVPVIIVAAGSSTRMQGQNKQFLKISGLPVIARTLLAFENCDAVSRIILVVRTEDIFEFKSLAEKYKINKLSDVVCGGKNRQESVLNGIKKLLPDEDRVLIHDGARPLVSDSIIGDVAKKLENYKAVTCGVKVKDTIKQLNSDGSVLKTLERSQLIAVQTPQGVWVKEYLKAIGTADNLELFTDDTSIMEAAGHTVFCTKGSYTNIKITTFEDILSAEGFLKDEKL